MDRRPRYASDDHFLYWMLFSVVFLLCYCRIVIDIFMIAGPSFVLDLCFLYPVILLFITCGIYSAMRFNISFFKFEPSAKWSDRISHSSSLLQSLALYYIDTSVFGSRQFQMVAVFSLHVFGLFQLVKPSPFWHRTLVFLAKLNTSFAVMVFSPLSVYPLITAIVGYVACRINSTLAEKFNREVERRAREIAEQDEEKGSVRTTGRRRPKKSRKRESEGV